jgi:hypothetical protein
MSYPYYTSNVLFNAENKKGNYHLPTVRFHSFKSYEQDCLPLHCLLDEELSVLGGLSTDVSLGLHTLFFLVAGVVVDLGD